MPRFFTSAAAILLLPACGAAVGDNNGAAAVAPASSAAPDAAEVSAAPEEGPDQAAPVAAAAAAPPTAGSAETSFARQLSVMLVGHATLDGRDVTGVRAIDKCHTAFATAGGETVIDWTRAGNAAAHDDGGRENTRLPGQSGDHVMSVEKGVLPEPAGNVANRSSGAFGQLALECGG